MFCPVFSGLPAQRAWIAFSRVRTTSGQMRNRSDVFGSGEVAGDWVSAGAAG